MSHPVLFYSSQLGCRAALSYAMGYFTPAGFIYNAVDLLVVTVAMKLFTEFQCCSELGRDRYIMVVLGAHILGGLGGFAVTVFCFGTMSVFVALALSVSSLVMEVLVVSLKGDCGRQVQPLISFTREDISDG